MKLKRIAAAAVLLIALTSAITVIMALPDPKFYEDFEAGNFNQWSNTLWQIDNADGAEGSSNSAECPLKTVCTMHSIIAADTDGVSNVNVSFWLQDHGMDVQDAAHWYWNNSAGNFDSMGLIDAGTLGLADDVWHMYSRANTSGLYAHPGFSVRIDAAPGNNEWYNVDSINITSETSLGDTCDCSSIQAGTIVDCTENCDITEICDASAQNIVFSGSGTVTIGAEVSNHGDISIMDACTVFCNGGCIV